MAIIDPQYTEYDKEAQRESLQKILQSFAGIGMGTFALPPRSNKFVPPYNKTDDELNSWDAATLQDILARLRHLEQIISAILLSGGIDVTPRGDNSKTESTVPGQ